MIELIKKSNHIVIMTGAGVSSESGVPIFRGKENAWRGYQPEYLSNIDTFYENPSLIWTWYQWRRDLISQVKPNQGHYAIAKLEAFCIKNNKYFTLITQNVDGLHIRAGSKNVLELHGNIFIDKCVNCGYSTNDVKKYENELPICPKCKKVLKPGVISFGESLSPETLQKSFQASMKSNLFLFIGSSGVVYPAADLPLLAKRYGAYTIEINTEKSSLADYLDKVILGKSGEVLPELLSSII